MLFHMKTRVSLRYLGSYCSSEEGGVQQTTRLNFFCQFFCFSSNLFEILWLFLELIWEYFGQNIFLVDITIFETRSSKICMVKYLFKAFFAYFESYLMLVSVLMVLEHSKGRLKASANGIYFDEVIINFKK